MPPRLNPTVIDSLDCPRSRAGIEVNCPLIFVNTADLQNLAEQINGVQVTSVAGRTGEIVLVVGDIGGLQDQLNGRVPFSTYNTFAGQVVTALANHTSAINDLNASLAGTASAGDLAALQDQLNALQASEIYVHELSTDQFSSDDSLSNVLESIGDKFASLGTGGGGSVLTPHTAWVCLANGNNSTGVVGDKSKPYLDADVAAAAAKYTEAGVPTIRIGFLSVGNYPNTITLTEDTCVYLLGEVRALLYMIDMASWNLTIFGGGAEMSPRVNQIRSKVGRNLYGFDIAFESIDGDGNAGTTGTNGAPVDVEGGGGGNSGNTGEAGAKGLNLILNNCFVSSVAYIRGGNGGQGGNGSHAEGGSEGVPNPGGSGGQGGDGGQGGMVNCVDTIFNAGIYMSGGEGGNGGSPGAGYGESDGDPGNQGPAGSTDYLSIKRCEIGNSYGSMGYPSLGDYRVSLLENHFIDMSLGVMPLV